MTKLKSEKNQQDIKFYLPEKLVNELDNNLKNFPPEFPPNYKYDRTVFLCILYDVFVGPEAHPELLIDDKPGYFPLYSEFLRKKYGYNYAYYLRYLTDYTHILICVNIPKWRVENECRLYKFNEKLIDDDDNLIPITISYNTRLWKHIHECYKNQKKRSNKLSPYEKIMRDHFYKTFRLDEDAIIDYMKRNNIKDRIRKTAYIKSINGGVKHKGLFFKRNNTNLRIDTNLTSLFSDSTHFIKSDELLVMIDWKNSQIFHFIIPMLRAILKSNNKIVYNINNNITPITCRNIVEIALERVGITDVEIDKEIGKKTIHEINQFMELTSNGKWYEIIKHILKCDRDKAKKEWMYLAYGKIGNKKYLENGLSYVFPTVIELIRGYKQDDYTLFSNFLTTIESICVIDHVCRRLVENNIIPYTKHDCVIVPISKLEETIKIINDVYVGIIGVAPSLNITELNRQFSSNKKQDIVIGDFEPGESISDFMVGVSQEPIMRNKMCMADCY